MKTNIMVDFTIGGDVFDPDDISKTLQLEPSSVRIKGEKINEYAKMKYSYWTISTDYEESLNASIQIKKIMKLIRNKVPELNYLKNKYKTEHGFVLVVNIEEGIGPTIILEKDFYDFLIDIDGFFTIDSYVFSR